MPGENTFEAGPGPGDAAWISLLAFWADAGVDTAYVDDPVDRLAQVARRGLPPAPDVPPRTASPRLASAAPDEDATADDRGLSRLRTAREAAAIAADLATLAEEAASFFGVVPGLVGRGAEDAAVVVIGDVPGAEDAAQGRPFSGPDGRLLDRMLAAAGLEGRVWLTYGRLRPLAPGGSAPGANDAALDALFLRRTVELIAPRALLLLGEGAVRAATGRTGGILTLRGRWFEPDESGGDEAGAAAVPSLATFHPAFLLRQPLAKKRAWEDLLTLAARVDRPGPPA